MLRLMDISTILYMIDGTPNVREPKPQNSRKPISPNGSKQKRKRREKRGDNMPLYSSPKKKTPVKPVKPKKKKKRKKRKQ